MIPTIITTKCYNDEVTLEFNPDNHRFYANGETVKSVTTYTGVLDKSTPLIIWATRLNRDWLLEKAPELVKMTDEDTIKLLIEESSKQHTIRKEQAADIGTQAHDWVEKFVAATKANKKPPALPKDKQVHNAVMAFLSWMNKVNPKFTENEKHIYSRKYKYAGILDAVALIKSKRVLIDFKTSKGIYSDHLYQTAGYQLAYEEMTGKAIDYRIVIKFGKEDGNFEVKELHDHTRDKKGFLACFTLKTIDTEITKELKKK